MNTEHGRLFLSPAAVEESDIEAVIRAMRSGWIAPVGPEIDLLEASMADLAGRAYAVSLSSGTAALHLALKAVGIGSTHEVVVPTVTFGATAFAVTYLGAQAIFLDVEEQSWNLDPALLEEFLASRARTGRLPRAVVTVDLFGRTCDYSTILPICEEYEVPVVCDSAEALGAFHGCRPAGSLGTAAVFSFNGNKIITSSGGGVLVTDDEAIAHKVRKWATQSREPLPWYQHEEIGFNYRLSNILAALGRSQLGRLQSVVERRRAIRDRYALALNGIAGATVMADPPWGRWNGWLTTVRFDSLLHLNGPTRVREALEAESIESRPIWKPMHQQPVFRDAEAVVTGVADRIFLEGLCLPSGTVMTVGDIDRVADVVLETIGDA